MFKHLIKSVALGLLLFPSIQSMAQTEVQIRLKDADAVKQHVVENKGMLFFIDDRLYIAQKASSAPVIYDLNSIRSVRFVQSSSDNEEFFADGGAPFLYPNPATDNVYVANVYDSQMVDVFSVDGALVLRQKYVPEAGLSVAALPNGLYFVKLGSQTFKLEKK